MKIHMGPITSSAPLFRRKKGERPLIVQGARADALTFDVPMCSPCNNVRSQPYDLSWQSLSEAMARRWDECPTVGRLWLSEAPMLDAQETRRNVHLFFLKIFGCRAIETDAPVDTQVIAQHLVEGTSHPGFFLVFGRHPGVEKSDQFALDMPMMVGAYADDRPHAVFGFYIVGRLVVEMIYYLGGTPLVRALPGMWHPCDRSKTIKFRALHDVENELARARVNDLDPDSSS